jgi:hypothetical protein
MDFAAAGSMHRVIPRCLSRNTIVYYNCVHIIPLTSASAAIPDILRNGKILNCITRTGIDPAVASVYACDTAYNPHGSACLWHPAASPTSVAPGSEPLPASTWRDERQISRSGRCYCRTGACWAIARHHRCCDTVTAAAKPTCWARSPAWGIRSPDAAPAICGSFKA